ncbi:hypothetical protein Q5P01_019150 [Channa striata]|uniref:Uncharacterized protein n=1 Tax=Channa striata TaxID=64152 RepID=A0AA88S5A0_CHASR|nr:hypothetical protein Q5P01_019150 [Channa striata]
MTVAVVRLRGVKRSPEDTADYSAALPSIAMSNRNPQSRTPVNMPLTGVRECGTQPEDEADDDFPMTQC